MWGWISIGLGLLSSIIAILPIQALVKKYFPRFSDEDLLRFRIGLVLIIAVVGTFGMTDRINKENSLKNEIKEIRKENLWELGEDGNIMPKE